MICGYTNWLGTFRTPSPRCPRLHLQLFESQLISINCVLSALARAGTEKLGAWCGAVGLLVTSQRAMTTVAWWCNVGVGGDPKLPGGESGGFRWFFRWSSSNIHPTILPGWWFQTFFHNIWDVILSIDELIFFKMVKTTNQLHILPIWSNLLVFSCFVRG